MPGAGYDGGAAPFRSRRRTDEFPRLSTPEYATRLSEGENLGNAGCRGLPQVFLRVPSIRLVVITPSAADSPTSVKSTYAISPSGTTVNRAESRKLPLRTAAAPRTTWLGTATRPVISTLTTLGPGL
jgi:hypothetical protein